MQRNVQQLSQNNYDLLVIGGGINGAAIAHVAAKEGLKVALIEKNDFASGTSSKSTKLVHGGIRYLENFDFELVHEALRERYIQIKNAPHLVKPLAFIIPVYRGDRRPLWMMKIGVWLYDFLCGKYRIGSHQTLSVEEVAKLEPNVEQKNLIGGVLYYDAQMDDARLCLENVLMAAQHGAHVANYVEMRNFIKEGDRVVGIEARDHLTQERFEIKAKKVICTVGPWSNALIRLDNHESKKIIRTTKGVHIVYKGQLTKHALLITSHSDSRIFFVIPWNGNSLIGTTDTDFIKNPDHVDAMKEDVEYLFKESQRIFPNVKLTSSNIVTTFAGLRPLIRKGGSAGKVSRKHTLQETESGLFYLIGGKYTTYRAIALECIGKMFGKKANLADESFPVYGSGKLTGLDQALASEFKVDLTVAQYLVGKYGSRAKDVLGFTTNNASLKEKLCDCSPAIKAQVIYSRDVEMAQVSDDVILRRLSLNYLGCTSLNCRSYIQNQIK